jgi:peptide/nickel transport system substrate-binding protein
MRLNRCLAVLLGFTAVLAPALGPAPARADAPSRDTMVVAALQDVDTLNPFVATMAASTQIFRLTYDYLTDYSPADNSPVPALAERWTPPTDGLTWTFHLRQRLQWSDGTPLTSKDVEFTYRTLMDRPTLANSALVQNFASVEATDPTTVVIRTKVPVPGLLSLDIPIVPAHLWAGRDPGTELTGAAALVGSGPFRLLEARPGRYYRFRSNPGYWRGAPKVDELIFRYFSDSDAAVQALRKGEVDVVGGLTPVQFDALSGDERIARNEAQFSRFTELGFNPGAARADGTPIGNGHPALRDVQVRRAIDHAIDRRTLVERVLGGHGAVGVGYLPPAFTPWGWQPPPGSIRAFDPAQANRMLDEAGYRRGSDGVRRMPTGNRRLSFNLLVPGGRAHYEQSSTYLTGWLAAIGIEVEPLVLTDSEKGARTASGRYDMFLGGWILDPDPDYLLSVQTCDTRPVGQEAGNTDTFACDRDYDTLYERQSQQIDRGQRAQTVQQMQQRLYERAELLTLYYPAVLEAYRDDRFAPLTRRPRDSGSVIGAWSYSTAVPLGPSPPDRGLPVLPLVGLGLAVLVIGGGLWRARATRDQRE